MIKRDLVVIGNILVGDASSYGHLLQFTQNQISLPARPEQLIFPQAAGAQPAGLGVDALPEAATICTSRDPAKLWRESREDVCSFDDVMGAFFAHGQRRMHAVRPVQDEGTAAAAGRKRC